MKASKGSPASCVLGLNEFHFTKIIRCVRAGAPVLHSKSTKLRSSLKCLTVRFTYANDSLSTHLLADQFYGASLDGRCCERGSGLTSVPMSFILASANSLRFPCSTPELTSGMGMSLLGGTGRQVMDNITEEELQHEAQQRQPRNSKWTTPTFCNFFAVCSSRSRYRSTLLVVNFQNHQPPVGEAL